MGSQIFVVLEIIFFPKPGIFCTDWLFALCVKTKWIKNPGNSFYILQNTFLLYPHIQRSKITRFYPSLNQLFFRKIIFIWFFGQKIEKSDPLDTVHPPIFCWAWKKLCLKLVLKSMIFIWSFVGINKITNQNMSKLPPKEINVAQTGPVTPLGTGKMAHFGHFWAEKCP